MKERLNKLVDDAKLDKEDGDDKDQISKTLNPGQEKVEKVEKIVKIDSGNKISKVLQKKATTSIMLRTQQDEKAGAEKLKKYLKRAKDKLGATYVSNINTVYSIKD